MHSRPQPTRPHMKKNKNAYNERIFFQSACAHIGMQFYIGIEFHDFWLLNKPPIKEEYHSNQYKYAKNIGKPIKQFGDDIITSDSGPAIYIRFQYIIHIHK